ncbi:hypothetical protein [Vibrio ishigakensis]|nr:hypothetical protein [Vibrio ishigakensis]
MLRSNIERIKSIQSHIGVEADGILGFGTLTELEKRLRLHC